MTPSSKVSFVEAARFGDLESLLLHIASGVDVDAKTAGGETALYAAAGAGHTHILAALLDAGAEPSRLVSAGRRQPQGGLATAAEMDATNALHDRSALNRALRNHALDAARLLLDRGANPRIVDSQHRTSAHNLMDIAEHLLDAPGGADKLVDLMKRMLDLGVPVNQVDKERRTLLHIALSKPMPKELLMLLLDYGADVEQQNEFGQTALHIAVVWDDVQAVRVLLDHGANVDARNLEGRSVFVQVPNAEVTAMLIAAGADVNARDIHGATVLSHLLDRQVSGAIPPVVAGLIEAGADLNLANFEGRESAADIIESRGLTKIAAFITSCRARQAVHSVLTGRGNGNTPGV